MLERAWRNSAIAAAVRVGLILLVLAAILAPPMPDAGTLVSVLLAPTTPASTDNVGQRLSRDIGSTAGLTLEPAVTNMPESLLDTLWKLDPRQKNVVVLATTGDVHPGVEVPLRQARAAGIPVYWLPLPGESPVPRIGRILAPALAVPGERIGVTVEVELAGPATLVVLVNGRPLPERGVLQSGRVHFQMDVPVRGPLLIGAEIRHAGGDEVLFSVPEGALVNVLAPPSILLVANRASLFGESLRRGGWAVTEITARELSGHTAALGAFAGLVLDDVSATDVADSVWLDIARSVRRDALGLLVLGGPHAFGLGSYRDSRLETLLPVVAEPPEDESPAGVMFLVDVSGSMGRATASNRRLQIARQAVMEAATSLRATDRIGLMSFDIDASELLEIAARPDHVQAIEMAWPANASGGTRLLPALQRARDALLRQDSEQKLLVLLTDGFLAIDEVAEIGDALRDTGVELLGIVIEDGQSTAADTLSSIASTGQGRIIRINDVLRLPVLLRNEIESVRPAVVTGDLLPTVAAGSTLLPADLSWPQIKAYSLTRPRAEASIHLQSARGDVLLASGLAGAGRVAVLTSGFSGWTADWLRWSEWPSIAAGLTSFIAARSAGELAVSVIRKNGSDETLLSVDIAGAEFASVDSAGLLLDPSGKVHSIELHRSGPGRLEANLPLAGFGTYVATVTHGQARTRYRFLHQPRPQTDGMAVNIVRQLLDKGLLSLWTADGAGNLQAGADIRSRLMVLVLVLFLLLLIGERFAVERRGFLLEVRATVQRVVQHVGRAVGSANY